MSFASYKDAVKGEKRARVSDEELERRQFEAEARERKLVKRAKKQSKLQEDEAFQGLSEADQIEVLRKEKEQTQYENEKLCRLLMKMKSKKTREDTSSDGLRDRGKDDLQVGDGNEKGQEGDSAMELDQSTVLQHENSFSSVNAFLCSINPLTGTRWKDAHAVHAVMTQVRQWQAAKRTVKLNQVLGEEEQHDLVLALSFADIFPVGTNADELEREWDRDCEALVKKWLEWIAKQKTVGAQYISMNENVLMELNAFNISLDSTNSKISFSLFGELAKILRKYQFGPQIDMEIKRFIWDFLRCRNKKSWGYNNATLVTKTYGEGLYTQCVREVDPAVRDGWSVSELMNWIMLQLQAVAKVQAQMSQYQPVTPGGKPSGSRRHEPPADMASLDGPVAPRKGLLDKNDKSRKEKGKNDKGSKQKSPHEGQKPFEVWTETRNLDKCPHCGSSKHFPGECCYWTTCKEKNRHPHANPSASISFLDSKKGKAYNKDTGRTFLQRERTERKSNVGVHESLRGRPVELDELSQEMPMDSEAESLRENSDGSTAVGSEAGKFWANPLLGIARLIRGSIQDDELGSSVLGEFPVDELPVEELDLNRSGDVTTGELDFNRSGDSGEGKLGSNVLGDPVQLVNRVLECDETIAEDMCPRSTATPLEPVSVAQAARDQLSAGHPIEISGEVPFYSASNSSKGGRAGIRQCTQLKNRCVNTKRVVFDDGSMLGILPGSTGDPSTDTSINVLIDEGSWSSNYLSRRLKLLLESQSKVLATRACQVAVQSPLGGAQRIIKEEVEFVVLVEVDNGKQIGLRVKAYVMENEMAEDLIIGIGAQITNKRVRQIRDQNQKIITQCWVEETLQRVTREQLLHHPAIVARVVQKEVVDDVSLPSDAQIHGSSSLQAGIRALLEKHRQVFSRELRSTPCLMDPMQLDVDRDKWESRKNQGPPRPQGTVRNQEIMRQVLKKLKANCIRSSSARYYSHPHLVKKGEDKFRLTVDWRVLNAATRPDRFPIPNITGMMDRIGLAKPEHYTIVDLTSGYDQCGVSVDSIPLTAFMTSSGIYEYLRVGQGLCGAPAHFQRQMQEKVLPGLLYNGVEVYLDDVLQFADNEADYLLGLSKLLQRLEDFKITVNPDKCQFGKSEIEYVGHTLSKDGKHFDRAKLHEVVVFPKPETQGEMKSFLGLANYFRDHIAMHSVVVEPLQRMTDSYNKRQKLVWDPKAEAAFVEIQRLINECPKLFFMDPHKPVHLYTDASDIGWGSYLCQMGEDGVQTPIGFCSKTFSSREKEWTVNEREAYAVYASITKFHYLLRDIEFFVHTDHKNLLYIKEHASPKVLRWKIALSEYNFTLGHIAGVDNPIADYFSRNDASPMDDENHGLPDAVVGTAAQYFSRLYTSSVDELASASEVDELAADGRPFMTPESEYLAAQSPVPASEYLAAQSFVTIDDEQYANIARCHNAVVGHHGVDPTMELLRELGFDWKYMRSHVKKFIRECDCCQKNNLRGFDIGCAKFTTGGKHPFETISFDHVGPLQGDPNGYTYALVVVDVFSRFVDIYPVKDDKAVTTAEALMMHFAHYETPSHIRTDGAPGFKSKVIAELMEMLECEHSITAADSHEENSIVERANKELNRWVRDLIYDKHKSDKTKWVSLLPYAMRIHNATKIVTLGCSPARLVFGTSIDLSPLIFSDRVLNLKHDEPMQDWVRAQTGMQTEIIRQAQELQLKLHKEHVSSKPVAITEYAAGSLVLLGWPVTRFNPQGRPTKWDTLYRGPYKVLGHKDQSYRLRNLATGKEVSPKNIHLLKPFYYDSQRVDPVQVALKDLPEDYLVEQILKHKGNLKGKKSSMSFQVKWLGYAEPTWESWKNVRENSVLHDYLRDQGHPEMIPSKFEEPIPTL